MRRKKRIGFILGILFLAMTILIGVETTVLAAEESENHLPDYSEMYGMDPIDDKAQVVLNKKGRAGTPQKVAYIAVFVEFPDLSSVALDDENVLRAAEMIMNKGGDAIGAGNISVPVSPLKAYMEKYSYDQLSVEGSFFPQDENGKVVSYMCPKTRGYFKKYNEKTNQIGYKNQTEQWNRERELINGAMEAVKESVERTLTPSQIDSGNDGMIDAISFFVEAPEYGTDDVGWGDLLWSHKTTTYSPTMIHGKTINAYNLIGTEDPTKLGSPFSYTGSGDTLKLNRADYDVIHHEYFHTLGLPDLYRGTASGSPVGIYDIMADSHKSVPRGITSIMQRDYLHWGNALEVVNNTKTVTLSRPKYKDASEKTAVKIYSSLNAEEYFVAEFYEKQKDQLGTVGRADGLILYRINNEKIGEGNINGTVDGLNDYMYIFRPGETTLGKGEGRLEDAVVLPVPGNTYGIADNETEGWNKDSLYFSNGENSGIKIEIVKADTDTITFNITVPDVSGTGTKEDPYLIRKAEDFALIKGSPKAHFKLEADIDFSSVLFTPIADFDGSLDGNHHKLSNVTITDGNGLFTFLDFSSSVKNLELVNINVSGSDKGHVGALAGSVGGAVSNVSIISGSVTATPGGDYSLQGTGGFAGTVTDSATLVDCNTSALVNGGKQTGGFVGLNQNAVLKNCFANGKVSGEKSINIGGFIGSDYISNEYVIPVNCAYNMRNTEQGFGQGGKDVSGVTGYLMPQEMTLDLQAENEKPAGLVTKPILSNVNPSVLFTVPGVARFNEASQTVIGLSAGKTDMNTRIAVGAHHMEMKTEVIVKDDTSVTKPIISVALDNEKLELELGGEVELTATILPEDTTDSKKLMWKSGNEDVATVDGNGKVNAVGGGAATITVTTSNGKTDTCEVLVAVPATGIKLNEMEVELVKGKTASIVAVLQPENTTDSASWSWESKDLKIASVDENGVITGVKAGETAITVSADLKGKKTLKAEVKVTVTTKSITSVTLNKEKLELEPGMEETLVASITPENTTDSKTLAWKSSNEDVATIDGNGKVHAVSGGTATLTVTTSNGQTDTCEVLVTVPATGIKLDLTEVTLTKGQSTSVTATLLPVDTTDRVTWSWETRDSAIATVDENGIITGVSHGETVITITAGLKTKRTLLAELKVMVAESLFEQLEKQYHSAKADLDNPAFIEGAPASFVEYLSRQVEAAQVIIANGAGNTPDEDIQKAAKALEDAVKLFSKVDSLNELRRLMEIDLSLYDTDTTADYKALQLRLQAVLDDPLGNQDKIETSLDEIQKEFAKIIKLDSAKLQNAISNAEAIILADYLDGKQKDAFVKVLAEAKSALQATTNKKFEEAASALEKAQEELEAVRKATAEQREKIKQDIQVLADLLVKNKYTEENTKIIKEALTNGQEALGNESLLFADAEILLAQLEEAKKVEALKEESVPPEEGGDQPDKPADPAKPEKPKGETQPEKEDKKQVSADKKAATKTGDIENPGLLYMSTLVSLSGLCIVIKKIRR